MLKKFLFLNLVLILLSGYAFAQSSYEPKIGDILFQDLDCGDFCNAVEAVTQGARGYDFSHMSIVGGKTAKGYFVYEALSKGVIKTSYHDFINRSLDANKKPKILVGRLKPKWQPLVPNALDWIKSKLHKPYDEGFDLKNDRYYCSEMIHLAFENADQRHSVFKPRPMTFKDPATHKTFPVWQTYFDDLKMPIPEGELGLNPGGMSRSSKIEIIFDMMKNQ